MKLFKIPVTYDEYLAWKNNEGYIDFNEEEFLFEDVAKDLYSHMVSEHYKEVIDDHDYFFEDWLMENEMYTYMDLESWDIDWNSMLIECGDEYILVIALGV
jgi:hypothetical protein